MFKKAVEAKSHQRLSGRNRLPLLTDELLDAILPPKVEITLSKFQNRVHVYSIEGGCPMFFDIDGRGTEIFPTVFALWDLLLRLLRHDLYQYLPFIRSNLLRFGRNLTTQKTQSKELLSSSCP